MNEKVHFFYQKEINSSMENIVNREKYLDVAKGIGISLVVYAHFIILGNVTQLSWVTKYIYAFHMPLFFFLSGYCQGLKEIVDIKISFFVKLKKIVFKLFLPYLIWSVIDLYISGELFISERLVAVITLRGIAPIWFLGALAIAEIAFLAFQTVLNKMNKSFCVLLYAGLAVLMFLAAFSLDILKINYNWSAETIGTGRYYAFITVGRFLVSFAILLCGYLFFKVDILRKFGKRYCGIIGAILLIALVILVKIINLNCNLHLFEFNVYGVFICAALLGSSCILMLAYSFAKYSKVLNYLGKISLGIMVLHYLPFRAMSYAAQIMSYICDNAFIISVFGTALTILISLLGVWLIKKKFFLSK